MQTSQDRVIEFLKQRPNERWTSKDIANELDIPNGTASSVTSQAYAETLKRGGPGVYGAGVYGLVTSDKNKSRQREYAWCSVRPDDEKLHPIETRARSNKKRPREAAGSITLYPADVAGIYKDKDENLFRLQPVAVEVSIKDVES